MLFGILQAAAFEGVETQAYDRSLAIDHKPIEGIAAPFLIQTLDCASCLFDIRRDNKFDDEVSFSVIRILVDPDAAISIIGVKQAAFWQF